jgi:UDP-2,3-diacylglucosamine hydrolase
VTAAGLPAIGTLQADAAWRCIDLLSDVHLHAEMPRTFDAWRTHLLGTPADAVLMLGDLFEVWIGDDAAGTGFAAECVAVLRQAASERALYFLPGNRDFLVGNALLAATGMQGLSDPTLLHAFGQPWLLSHGDALCLDDVDYLRFRAQVRAASMAHQADLGPTGWSDVDADEAARWLAAAGSSTLVHGHTHRPGTHALPGGSVRHVLGDWDVDHDTPRARILRLTATGLQPLDLAAP